MADYPILAPTLGALNVTKTDPTQNEDASKISLALVQTRVWSYDFLSTIVDSTTGKIKASAIGEGSVSLGVIRGSEGNDPGDAAREILQGTVSFPDLRDGAVSGAKLADGAVTTDKIPDDTISASKIQEGAVRGSESNIGAQQEVAQGTISTPDLRDGAVTSGKVGVGAITTQGLADEAVTSAKIANNGVDGVNLPTGIGGQILLHNGTKYVSTTVSGGLVFTPTGVATVAISATTATFIRLSERASAGVNCGASVAASFAQTRGVSTAWTIDEQTTAGTVVIGAAGAINIQTSGLYMFFISVPAFETGKHKMRLHIKSDPSGSFVDYYGSSESSGAAASTVQTRSFLIKIVSITNASSTTPAVFQIDHWTELVSASGLGIATGNQEERYTQIELLKIS